MTAFTFDRIMSLHRRAYDCATAEDWTFLAGKLDCPADVVDQFYRTASAAKESGMTKQQAFPLTGEMMKLQAEKDAALLMELNNRIARRDEIAGLCGEIIATLSTQRNAAPLTEAGVAVDDLVKRWAKRLKVYETPDDVVPADPPLAGESTCFGG